MALLPAEGGTAIGWLLSLTDLSLERDADACPRAAKDLVVKFALKRQFEVVMAARAALTAISPRPLTCAAF